MQRRLRRASPWLAGFAVGLLAATSSARAEDLPAAAPTSRDPLAVELGHGVRMRAAVVPPAEGQRSVSGEGRIEAPLPGEGRLQLALPFTLDSDDGGLLGTARVRAGYRVLEETEARPSLGLALRAGLPTAKGAVRTGVEAHARKALPEVPGIDSVALDAAFEAAPAGSGIPVAAALGTTLGISDELDAHLGIHLAPRDGGVETVEMRLARRLGDAAELTLGVTGRPREAMPVGGRVALQVAF